MSRKPSATKTGLSRTASAASLAMPPPKSLPTARPPSQSSHSGEEGKVILSPRKTSIRKGGVNGSVNGNVNGGNTKVEASGAETNIQVVVRCRGRSPQELATTSPIITTTAGALSKTITVETTPSTSMMGSFTTASSYGGGNPMTKTYPFDKVFGPEADQTMVFGEVAEGMLDEVLAGYNCTIFAYGQTGTGKTYTMQGDLELSPLNTPTSNAGIVPRVLYRLFQLLEASQNTEYTVRCSYVELYNEELRDLLSPEYQPVAAGEKQPMSLGQGGNQIGAGAGLKLYEDGKKGVLIQGLEEVGVRTLKEALGQVHKGVQRRQVAETKMNTESSRSHTIFSVTVHVKETTLASGGDDLLRIGKFNLVDLAGSEAIGRSGATDKRAREAGMINQSLLTLGRVISALTEKSSHIPYRESKLTRLLQDSLGGRTKTCIVATVSPTRSNMEETLSTLDYAIRAKSIRNRPEINAHLTKSGVLKEYLGDIERLKAEVMAAREKNGIYIPEEQWKEMFEEQVKLKSELQQAQLIANSASVELNSKRKEFEILTEQFLITTEELRVVRESEKELMGMVEDLKQQVEEVTKELEEEKWVSKAYVKGEERLDGVAKGLKGVAEESVSDVGGLFEKLARKAKVLGENTDSATKFGNEMSTLSSDLRNGLDKLNSVQNRFGEELAKGLEAFNKHSQKHSKKDLANLETSFSSFNDLSTKLTESIEAGKMDAAETGIALQQVKEEVQTSVREWAQEVEERSQGMVRDLLAHQHEHLTMVGSVFSNTVDLVDNVITSTQKHLKEEAVTAQKTLNFVQQTSSSEMARLQAQNDLLMQLLIEEKEKTAKLRTELIGNLTNLIVGFTNAQDQSLTSAINNVQQENKVGIKSMQSFNNNMEEVHQQANRSSALFGEDLLIRQEDSSKQRKIGQNALREVESGMKVRLENYGRKTIDEFKSQRVVVDGFCERLGETSAQAAKRAEERAIDQSNRLSDMTSSVKSSNDSARSRIMKEAEGVTTFTDSVLNSHASSSKSYTKHHASTSNKLDSILSSTAEFLTSGISEDIPTGETPKKRSWTIQKNWERTQPRNILIDNYRKKKASGELPNNSDESSESSEQSNQVQQPSSTTINVEISTEDEDHTLKSLKSMESLNEVTENLTTKIPGLSNSQIRLPSNFKSKSGLDRSVSGNLVKKNGNNVINTMEEKISVAPLGESGMNVPRRGRR